ncbi:hypothetical protein KKF91_04940 [Myxococcota bacterium]|nr:hypothetical protein [Myxococcota bacterium]MBU1429893.1 hypothetical protein [Myxococcota bacterium]MBU1896134.1 hypothetical protein [Myxococcota bacterium]
MKHEMQSWCAAPRSDKPTRFGLSAPAGMIYAALLIGAVMSPAWASRPSPALEIKVEGHEEGATLRLNVEVRVMGRLPGAPTLALKLPEGARLEAGLLEEALLGLEIGSALTRRFTLRDVHGAPVEVEARAVSEAAGVRARAVYPTPSPQPSPRVAPLSIRPVRVGGMIIREAIPLKPTQAPPR